MEEIYAAYEELANAVILQAVKDYRAAFRRHRTMPNNRSAQEEMDRIKKFFYSDYFKVLTDLDGPALLRKILQELEKEIVKKGGGAL